MIRAVLDTNVLASGFANHRGPSARLIDAWRKRDPIRLLEAELVAQGRLEAAEIAAIEKAAARQIEDALEFAKASPDPDPLQLTRDVYAG